MYEFRIRVDRRARTGLSARRCVYSRSPRLATLADRQGRYDSAFGVLLEESRTTSAESVSLPPNDVLKADVSSCGLAVRVSQAATHWSTRYLAIIDALRSRMLWLITRADYSDHDCLQQLWASRMRDVLALFRLLERTDFPRLCATLSCDRRTCSCDPRKRHAALRWLTATVRSGSHRASAPDFESHQAVCRRSVRTLVEQQKWGYRCAEVLTITTEVPFAYIASCWYALIPMADRSQGCC